MLSKDLIILNFEERLLKNMVNNSLTFKLGETKLICWSMGLTDPILSKKKKLISQNFGQLAFFKIYDFTLFAKK